MSHLILVLATYTVYPDFSAFRLTLIVLTKLYPIRALDACASLNIDRQKVPHILWECRSFEPQRVWYGIDQQILADTLENATNLIRFIKNIGMYNEK
jgi:hypothetical protein